MTPIPIAATAAVLGAVVASYVTTAALRASSQTAPTGARSQCDGCGRTLGWSESLPLVSFAVLGGRCRTCAAAITPVHPIGEAVGVAAGLGVALAAPDLRALPLVVMASLLLGASVIDARLRILPDLMTGGVALMALLLAATRGAAGLVEGLVAAAVSLVLLGGLSLAYRRRRGQVGLGWGDVLLFSALALWLGAAAPWMVLGASLLGLATLILKRGGDGKIALGPMIAGAGFGIGLLLEAGAWPRL